MIIHDRSFPHPVLTPFRDDVTPNEFSVETSVSPDADNFYIDVRFLYSNPTLLELVKTGKATHSVHIECKRNFYRELFSFQSDAQHVVIQASELVGRVEVSGFIRAQGPIDDYCVVGAHPDYGNSTFQIHSGDILAVCPTQSFEAYTDYDPLRDISSILIIRRDDERDEGAMTLETNEDRIVATLARRDYERYTDLKADPSMVSVVANQVVVPALLEAVHEIREAGDDEFDEGMADRRWYRSVYMNLKNSGVDLRTKDKPAIEAVQTLLKLPLRRSLQGLIQLNPMDETV
jgi:hypothetical protein